MLFKSKATKTEEAINDLRRRANDNATNKGFWKSYDETLGALRETDKNLGERYIIDSKLARLALIASEIGEAVEAVRKPVEDEHCKNFLSEEIELADVMIRIFDYSHQFGIRLGEAITAKMEYNASKPHMHGKSA